VNLITFVSSPASSAFAQSNLVPPPLAQQPLAVVPQRPTSV
jgi:hypothetical protein